MNFNDNPQQQAAYRLIAETASSFFLTGRAGTGKTTFLHNVQKSAGKNFLVLAPTGVAAILAGGVTIHSFFGFPLEVLGPKEIGKVNTAKRQVLEATDTIVIDEVSMVRCDIIDAIDRTLRAVLRSPLPFAGKQMVFMGDMHQLPPVMSTDTDREVIHDNYATAQPFFFKAHVLRHMRLPAIELNKVYRQEDADFLRLLGHVRDGHATADDMRLLNQRVSPEAEDDESLIILTPYNKQVDSINRARLAAIEKPAFTFQGTYAGTFKKEKSPVETEITLKEGARVMMCRNDSARRWANGTLATVATLNDKDITVRLDNGKEYNVEKATWEEYVYSYDKEEKRVNKETVGTFTQYPLRLAWAITIHRSQGMTFERMHLDVSHGVNTPGQLYVALSRARTLGGLTLGRPITPAMISTDEEVRQFASTYNDSTATERELRCGAALYPAIHGGDCDAATLAALLLAKDIAAEGDAREAAYVLGKMLGALVCDDHLLGKVTDFTPLAAPGLSARFVNAALCLYSGRYEEGCAYANEVLQTRQCLPALYIKSRCLTLQGRYDEADTVSVEMIDTPNGKNDLKVLLAVATVNKAIGDPCLGILRRVLKDRPTYFPVLAKLREEMSRQTINVESGSLLANAFNDKTVAAAAFRKQWEADEKREALTDALLKIAF